MVIRNIFLVNCCFDGIIQKNKNIKGKIIQKLNELNNMILNCKWTAKINFMQIYEKYFYQRFFA